jgi:hypothetical protein
VALLEVVDISELPAQAYFSRKIDAVLRVEDPLSSHVPGFGELRPRENLLKFAAGLITPQAKQENPSRCSLASWKGFEEMFCQYTANRSARTNVRTDSNTSQRAIVPVPRLSF